MATNSILCNLNSEDMISTIKLEMGADINREKVFVVVEGVDDEKFFKYFLKQNVSICESYSGKKGIKEILEHFPNIKNIIGIRDRDYENKKLDKRILFYDFCNIEMMLINNDETFERVFCEYYNGENEMIALRNFILNNLIMISNLRKINEEKMKMWKFNGVNYIICINEDNTLDNEKILLELLRINPTYSKEDFLEELEVKDSYTYNELLQITNGHDFVSLFWIYCKKSGTRNLSIKSLTESIRCAFGRKNFEETQLYNDLLKYQNVNRLKII